MPVNTAHSLIDVGAGRLALTSVDRERKPDIAGRQRFFAGTAERAKSQ
jgi:hypothetical protein